MSGQPQRTYEFGAFRLDVAEQRLLRDGEPVLLTPKMFKLLQVLVENGGHLVEKERLMDEVWSDTFVEDANLNRGISVLRKALGETSTAKYIETVPKRGYRFVAPVRACGCEARVTDESPHIPQVNESTASIPRRRSRWPLGIAAGTLLTIGAIAYAIVGRIDSNGQAIPTRASIHRQLTFTGKELTPTLSPDGKRIAYVSNESPRRKVMVRELAGGQPVEVFGAPETGWLRWSPDSSELMFWARGEGTDGLYIAMPPGGGVRRIAHGPFVACWSPDGSTIALALFTPGQIVFVNKVGEVLRTISLKGTRDWIWDLDWSSVNDRLLFVADDEQRQPTVWSIRPDGTEQAKVVTAPTEILAARWAPAAKAFYYFARVNQTVSLYKVFVDTDRHTTDHPPTPLLSGLETDEGFGLSADGTRLVYARAPYYANLWLVEITAPQGSQRIRQTQLTRGTSVIERPRVSPDGESILFSMGYESQAYLYTIPAIGGTPTQLTFLNAFSIGGVWSPDGRSVAFASNEGGKARAWLTNADGSSAHPLPTGEMSESFDMAWAPGSHLLYQQAGNRNYYMLDLQTHQQRLLIKDSSVGWMSFPTYSPDGRKIAVGWNRRPARGLWVIDTETLRESLIYELHPDSGALPISWSPDGRFIYLFDGKRAAYRGLSVPYELTMTKATILRVPANGGDPETVLTLPFEEVGTIAAFPDGRRFVCTVYTSRSDVWVVEDFDVSAESRIARRSILSVQ